MRNPLDELSDLTRINISLSKIFNDLAALPASFTLAEIKVIRPLPQRVKLLRENFDQSVKSTFLKYIGTHHGLALLDMGVSHLAIDAMRDHGIFPKTHKGERLDCSVDHIVSLGLGGRNRFSNLSLVPHKINALKNHLEMAQKEKDVIFTIVPQKANNWYVKVPYVSGGYQIRT